MELAEFGGKIQRNADAVAQKALEHYSEVSGNGVGDILHGYLALQLSFHGRHWLRSDTAGNDEVKVIEVGIHVESKAMGGHSARDMDADSGDFGLSRALLDRTAEGGRAHVAVGGPHAGESGNALCRDTEIRASANENFFQSANIVDCAQRLAVRFSGGESAEIEDGVTDQLSGTVKSYIATAVTFEYFDATFGQAFR